MVVRPDFLDYEEEIEDSFIELEDLENVESVHDYCKKNGIRSGVARDKMYTGLVEGERYFIGPDPNIWDVSSHLVADAFLEQYDIKNPDIDYIDGELVNSGYGELTIPVNSFLKGFKVREIIPNFVQRPQVEPESLKDSFFVHLAGGDHDLSGNVVATDEFAYPIDSQTFGKKPVSKGFESFIEREKNTPELYFHRYKDRLGVSAGTEEFRYHVSDRAREFDREWFWDELEKKLEDVDNEIAGNSVRFGENIEEYVGRLEEA